MKPTLTWSLVTEPSMCTLILRFAVVVFGWETWSLTPFCLLAILDSAFAGFLTGVSEKVRKNDICNRTEQKCTNIKGKPISSNNRQINDDKWKLSPYPLWVTGAGVSGVCWRRLTRGSVPRDNNITPKGQRYYSWRTITQFLKDNNIIPRDNNMIVNNIVKNQWYNC